MMGSHYATSRPGISAKRVFSLGVPAIHVFLFPNIKTLMPGTSPGMTSQKKAPAKPGPFRIGKTPIDKNQRE
jgi:hypothetical protein